jgi:arylsulfatase A-like enzyme
VTERTRIAVSLGAAVVVAGLALATRTLDLLGSRSAIECEGCNLVLVSADTLRADHLGCYGYEPATSPVIDRFAAGSIRFANAYSASAWTLPGHLAMLTGRYPVRESEVTFLAPGPLPDSEVTLAQILKRAGYATAGFTGGGYVGEGLGFGRGFDVYTTASEKFAGSEPAVSQWLSQRDSSHPFLLFFHGYDVHAPYDPPASLRTRFPGDVPEKCVGLELRCNAADYECLHGPGGREYLVSQYDAEIGGVDAALRWLLDELQRLGLSEKTVIVFTADHGENLMDDASGSCGHGADLHEQVFRVPLIIRVPGVRPLAVESRVSLVDLVPTLLEILGVPAPARLHGASLLGVISGNASGRQINGVTALDRGAHVLAAIAGDRKIVARRAGWDVPWTYELYDLRRDSAATHDLVPLGASTELETMKAKLFAWVDEVGLHLEPGDVPPGPMPADVRDRLEMLGYR